MPCSGYLIHFPDGRRSVHYRVGSRLKPGDHLKRAWVVSAVAVNHDPLEWQAAEYEAWVVRQR